MPFYVIRTEHVVTSFFVVEAETPLEAEDGGKTGKYGVVLRQDRSHNTDVINFGPYETSYAAVQDVYGTKFNDIPIQARL